ncbi:MAG TPA: hypothetical protein ACFYD3_04635 [Candidatus Hypogeohydataceae bacterium YC41]
MKRIFDVHGSSGVCQSDGECADGINVVTTFEKEAPNVNFRYVLNLEELLKGLTGGQDSKLIKGEDKP